MDPLSHALLGAAGGQGLVRRHGRAAALAGFAGAMLPDADVLIGAADDPLLNIEFHRHFSHAIVSAPLGALLAATLVWLVLRRRAPFAVLYGSALIGFLSAILLDACTSYGTRLLWPLAETRFAWSVVAVVDPLFTLILLVGVGLALWRGRPGPATVALALAVLYLGFGWLQRERAEAYMETVAAARGHRPERLEVKPTMGNLLLWRSIYLSGGRYLVDGVRAGLDGSMLLYPGAAVPRVTAADFVPPLPAGSVQAADIARFGMLSEGYLVRHPERPRVIGDVRYALLPDSPLPLWGVVIDPTRPQRHVAFETFRDMTGATRRRFLAMLRGTPPAALPP
ncbi:MAG: metal-dependent hydrolase [Pseudomonadota bacterium]|jgi:inner membrane protein